MFQYFILFKMTHEFSSFNFSFKLSKSKETILDRRSPKQLFLKSLSKISFIFFILSDHRRLKFQRAKVDHLRDLHLKGTREIPITICSLNTTAEPLEAIALQIAWWPPFSKDRHPRITTTTSRPHSLMDSPCSFPFPILSFPTPWH